MKIAEIGQPVQNSLELEMYKRYEVSIYFHNNADKEYNKKINARRGIALHTKVSADFPKVIMGGTASLKAAVRFGETVPMIAFHEIQVSAAEPIALRCVEHSVKIHTYEAAWDVNGMELPEEELFSEEGTLVGITKLDGTVRGGEKYAGKVVYLLETVSIFEQFQNILRADRMKKGQQRKKYLLGVPILCKEVTSITFLDSMEGAPQERWDVSEAGDGSVFVWSNREGSRCEVFIAGEGGVIANPDCSDLFRDCSRLETICFHHHFDTSLATDMRNLFYGCKNLKELDLDGLDTSQVLVMGRMFCQCSGLERLNVGRLDTSRVKNMRWMFGNCRSLKELDLSNFDTSQVKNMNGMFIRCSMLERLEMGRFVLENVTDMDYMFWDCRSLQGIDFDYFQSARIADKKYLFRDTANQS